MTEQRAAEPAKRSLAATAIDWALRNVKVAAAFIGGMGTAVVLVFNAGRDYQEAMGKIEANHAEIQDVRSELRLVESLFSRELQEVLK